MSIHYNFHNCYLYLTSLSRAKEREKNNEREKKDKFDNEAATLVWSRIGWRRSVKRSVPAFKYIDVTRVAISGPSVIATILLPT